MFVDDSEVDSDVENDTSETEVTTLKKSEPALDVKRGQAVQNQISKALTNVRKKS